MAIAKKVEYRVIPVTRYIVSRYEESLDPEVKSAGCEQRGEFDNEDTAYAVGYALCAEEHRRVGTPLDDPNFQYPRKIEMQATNRPKMQPAARI